MDRREFLKLSGMAAAGLSSFDPRAALAADNDQLVTHNRISRRRPQSGK